MLFIHPCSLRDAVRDVRRIDRWCYDMRSRRGAQRIRGSGWRDLQCRLWRRHVGWLGQCADRVHGCVSCVVVGMVRVLGPTVTLDAACTTPFATCDNTTGGATSCAAGAVLSGSAGASGVTCNVNCGAGTWAAAGNAQTVCTGVWQFFSFTFPLSASSLLTLPLYIPFAHRAACATPFVTCAATTGGATTCAAGSVLSGTAGASGVTCSVNCGAGTWAAAANAQTVCTGVFLSVTLFFSGGLYAHDLAPTQRAPRPSRPVPPQRVVQQPARLARCSAELLERAE
jgi:hypothetical protein